MEIHWTGGEVALACGHDFTAFKLVIHDGAERWQEVEQAFSGLARFDGKKVAWVSRAGLIRLAGGIATQPWLDSVAEMVTKARRFGWIDEVNGDIRAHVEQA